MSFILESILIDKFSSLLKYLYDEYERLISNGNASNVVDCQVNDFVIDDIILEYVPEIIDIKVSIDLLIHLYGSNEAMHRKHI